MEGFYSDQNRRNYFLCDVCGYKWEFWKEEDLLRKEISLENDLLKEEIPKKCPSCGSLYLSEF